MKQLCAGVLAPLCLFACVDLDDGTTDDLEAETSELTLVPGPPGPVIPPIFLPAHNRMIWRDNAGVNGELWIINDTGSVATKTPFSFPGRAVLGVAGDRILWNNGGNAELRSFDDAGVIGMTAFPVAIPSPGSFVPRSISLATNPCWSRTSQDYYILWDDVDHDEVAIQLVDNQGRQRRVNFVHKPLTSSPALWFGIAADGFEELMIRSGLRDASLYRSAWSTAQQNFVVTPTVKSVKSRPNHQPSHAGRLISSQLLWRGTWDQVLFIDSATPNIAKLEIYHPTGAMAPVASILAGAPPITYSYTGPANQFAQAFVGNPNICP